MNAIEITGLCKTYPDFALKNLNLTLPSGCILGLIGENGAGKSTTIKLMLDMLRRDKGEIRLLGQDNRENLRLLKEDIGVVLDEVGLPACLNAVQVGKIMKKTYQNWDEATYRGYLRTLSIPENKQFRELSRGMKMKLGIAVALSHQAKLLILDEATSGLDPIVRDEILDIFCEFTRDESHAILISSHIVSDLEKLCDYVAFLHKGELLLCEEKDTLRERYVHIQCTAQEFATIPSSYIVGKRDSAYGVEAIVKREAAPANVIMNPVDIEQLFIFMAKEAK